MIWAAPTEDFVPTFGQDSLVKHAVFSDGNAVHNDGIANDGSLSDHYTASDDRIDNLSVNSWTLTNDTLLDRCIVCDILRRKDFTLCKDPPVFFIKIKFRNDIDKFIIYW